MAPQKKNNSKSRGKRRKNPEPATGSTVEATKSVPAEAQKNDAVRPAEEEPRIDEIDQKLRSLRDEVTELHTEIASSREVLARLIAQTISLEGTAPPKGSGRANSRWAKLKLSISAFFKRS